MTDFDLDLGAIEQDLSQDVTVDRSVVLGVLDGTTSDEDWVREIDRGNVLVLRIDGEMSDLVSGFAEDIKADGGSLVHFRGFLIVAPSGITVDTDRL